MHNTFIKKKFRKYRYDDVKKPKVKEICEIISNSNLQKNKDYSFEDLYKLIPKELKNKFKEEFYDAVFILASRRSSILKQGFKVLKDGRFRKYPHESEIVEMLRNEDYTNPLTGEYFGNDVEKFSKEVITYFDVL